MWSLSRKRSGAETARHDKEERLYDRYQRMASYPLFALSLVFLVAFAISLDSSASPDEKAFAAIVMPVTWTAFAVDYAIGLLLSEDRLAFIRTHVIQATALLFPPMRILLLGHAFNVLRRTPLRRGDRARTYILYLTTLLLVICAILVVYFERQAPNANLTSFGDALWWGGETVSTVGYGDYYPVTVGGRLVAAVLFVNGVAMLSIITAGLAQNFTSDDSRGKAAPSAPKATDPHKPAVQDQQDPVGGGASTDAGQGSATLVTIPRGDLDRLHARMADMERALTTMSQHLGRDLAASAEAANPLAPPSVVADEFGALPPANPSRQDAPPEAAPRNDSGRDTPPAAPGA